MFNPEGRRGWRTVGHKRRLGFGTFHTRLVVLATAIWGTKGG